MQRYFSNNLENNKFILNNDDIYHIVKVMRMKDKEKIEVVYNHNVYLCELDMSNNLEVKKLELLSENIQNDIKRVLIVPLLKEQKFDLILQKATELGVDEIIPLEMERSIVKITDDKMEKKLERWSKICKEASEQSKRTDIPSITKVKKIKDLKDLDGLKMVCSTVEKENLLKKLENCTELELLSNWDWAFVSPTSGNDTNGQPKVLDLSKTKIKFIEKIFDRTYKL